MAVGLWTSLALAAAGCGDTPQQDVPPPSRVGDITVRFELTDGANEPVTCEERSLVRFRVVLAGEEANLECGQAQETRFENRLPGRYPVVIQLFGPGGAISREHLGNVVLEPGLDAEYEHVFVLDGGTFATGTLDVRWFIDGVNPAEGCLTARAEQVRLTVRDGPQDPLTRVLPCLDRLVVLEDIRQGTYDLFLELLDESGERIGFPATVSRLRVDPGRSEPVLVDFVTFLPEPLEGSMLALWTVSGSVAEDGCARLRGGLVEVAIRADEPMSPIIGTATVACARGGLGFDRLPPGRGSSGRGLIATFLLLERVPVTRTVDTQVLRDIVLEPNRTSTITVDFTLPSGL